MPSERDPADSLTDIIENAERIADYLIGVDRTAFAADGKLRDAVERCLERVAEAAHRLGPSAAMLVPGQPWAEIRGMGNRLRHAYDWFAPRRSFGRSDSLPKSGKTTLPSY